MSEDLKAKVLSVIMDQLDVSKVDVENLDASFVEDLGADSLDNVELVMALEEEFGIEIPDEQAEKITTVGEAIAFVEQHAVSEEG